MEKSSQPQSSTSFAATAAKSSRRFLYYYVWLIAKNVIGWALIIASLPVGIAAPGPFGLPLFFIGFAMITFPGKRGLTSRVLRGRPILGNSPRRIAGEALAALLLPGLIVWILSLGFYQEMQQHASATVITVYVLSTIASWMLIRLSIRAANYGLTYVPGIRRKVRPWMRRKGIDLLPPAVASD